jgi:hypothetical protein
MQGKAKELPSSTQLQVEAFLDGRKPAVLFMNNDAGEYLPDYEYTQTDQGQLVVSDQKYLDLFNNGEIGLSLGYGIPNKPGKGAKALTVYTKDGAVMVDIMTDGRKEVEEAALNLAGDGYIKYREQNDVVHERREYWK